MLVQCQQTGKAGSKVHEVAAKETICCRKERNRIITKRYIRVKQRIIKYKGNFTMYVWKRDGP